MSKFEIQKREVVEDLAREMRRREVSVAETAAGLEVDPAYLYRCIKAQRSPSMAVIEKWAGLYGITLKVDIRLSRIPL
jgi:hypothetical protein